LDALSEIREFIVDSFMLGRKPEELKDTASLLDLGIIDSTGVLELVGFLEEKYKITIEDEELVPDNLDSINNLVSFVQKKQGVTDTVGRP